MVAALAIVCTTAFAAPPPPEPLPRPLTLDAALNYATKHNPGLLRVREQIREQQGVLIEAQSARLPAVGASGQYSRTDEALLSSPLYEQDNWNVAIRATQLLYAGGGVKSQVRAQREQLEAARLGFIAALNDTLLSVRSRFFDVLLAREMIGVQEEALRVLETELTNARSRRDVGSGSEFELLRAEVALANARPALIRARNAYITTQDQLRLALGAPVSDPGDKSDLDVQGSLEVPQQEIGLDEALRAARAQRPELLRQERIAQAAEQGVTAARSGYLPAVSAYAGHQWMNAPLTNAPEPRLDGWTAGVQANWAIFDGRATAGRVQQARSRAAQARYGTEERMLAVDVEVRQVHSSLVEARELLVSAGKVVEQARESLRLAQARYRAGTATQLDVLTAQSQLTLARSNLAQAQHGHAVALASLRRAMGVTSGELDRSLRHG